MSLMDRWNDYRMRRAAELLGKASATGHLVSINKVGKAVWTSADYENFAKEGYQKNVVAFRCIKYNAQTIACVPFKLMKGDTEVEDHDLLTLMRRPNPMTGGKQFFESVVSFGELAGNSYLEAVGPDSGPPLELWSLRPDRMRPIAGSTGMPAGYVYTVNGQETTFLVNPVTGDSDILHLKSFHPTDDWLGFSAIEAAGMAIDQHNWSSEWNAAMLQNAGVPTGALTVESEDNKPRELTGPQRQELQSQIDEQISGTLNSRRPLLLEGGLKWVSMSLSAIDMDWLNGKHTSARDICNAFGTPPELIGIPGDSTYNTYAEARLAYYEEKIIPTTEIMFSELNNWLVPMFGDGLELKPDWDNVSALEDRRLARSERLKNLNHWTLNERRASDDLEALPGGDELLIPAGLLPASFEPSDLDKGKYTEYLTKLGYEKADAEKMADFAYEKRTLEVVQ